MGMYCDFAIKYDPSVDKPEDITKRVLYSLIVRRLKARKPVVMFIGGDSGEGKSFSALRLQEILFEIQGLDLKDYLEDINVYTPLEYPVKLNRLLGLQDCEKNLKKINIICMHEAREIIKAKQWHTFLNQAIADVNAMSRSIKRMCFIIISQFIRDISSDVRYTLTYYCKVTRGITSGAKAQLKINMLWKDDSDLEKPKLRRRNIRGYIIYPGNKWRLYIPKYLELSKPSKETIEIFEKRDFESKASIIRKKIEKLIQEMKVEMEVENRKVDAMVTWYTDHQENLTMIGRMYRGRWKPKPEVKIMHDLTDAEVVQFERLLNESLVKYQKKIVGGEDENDNDKIDEGIS